MQTSLPGFQTFAFMATLLTMPAIASAQTVAPLNATSPVVTSTFPGTAGPAGHTGKDGYDFFHAKTNAGNANPADPSTDVVSLPGYVTGFTEDSSLLQYQASTSVNVSGTTYTSGVIYSPTYGVTAAAPQTFFTFELTGSVPSAFDVGLLQNYNENTVFTLSLYSGTPSTGTFVTSAVLSDGATYASAANNFYYGEVSGASAGDYLVVTGAPSGGANQVTLGAITFDTVTPEPSTYALMFLGLGALISMARLRRA